MSHIKKINQKNISKFKEEIEKYQKEIHDVSLSINNMQEKIIELRDKILFDQPLQYPTCRYDHIPEFQITYDNGDSTQETMLVCPKCYKDAAYSGFMVIKKETVFEII